MRITRATIPILILLMAAGGRADESPEESVCFGTTADGRLENGRRLPRSGPNYEAYSAVGVLAGRTYVHSRVRRVVLDAYRSLANTMPEIRWVYGETGFREGGRFRPHKTHQNGLSLDHMVPVRDATGRSVPLPTRVANNFGYSVEFDTRGRYESLTIDADALGALIHRLHLAALDEGIDIWRVIFDPELQPLLHGTSRWPYLERYIEFSNKRSWVRHDEHIHVDFRVPCG